MTLRQKSILLTVATGTVLSAVLVGWQNAERRRLAEDRLAALVSRRLEIQAALRRAETRLTAAAAAPVTAAAARTAEEERVGDVRMVAPRLPGATGDDLSRLIEATRHDPAVENADNEAYRVQLGWLYAGLFRRLGIAEEQARRFVDTMLKRSAQHRDLLVAARSLGLSDHDPAVITLNTEADKEYLATQSALLGEAGLREMQRYDDNMTSRNIAMGFAGMATLANVPLTTAQVEQLARIIAGATGPVPHGPFPMRINIDWERVDAEARAVLTERQAVLFKNAEAPGIGRGGTRFMMKVNQTIMTVNRAEIFGLDDVGLPE